MPARRGFTILFWLLASALVPVARAAPAVEPPPASDEGAPADVRSGADPASGTAAKPGAGHGAPEAPPDFSRQPYVIEKYYLNFSYQNDGSVRFEKTVRVHIQSEAGVQQFGQLVFDYNSANEKTDIGYVRVLKPDGTTVTAGADAVQDLSAPVTLEAPVYTDLRQKHVTVPGLRTGDTLEFQVINSRMNPMIPGHFWLTTDFVTEAVVLDEQLVVDVPRDRKVKLKTADGATPAITEKGKRRIYTWTHQQLETPWEHDDDSDDEEDEDDEPEPPAIQLTTLQSWEDIGRWYAALEKDRVAPTPAIREKAAELTRGLRTDQEKIEALYDFVALNFRYVSLSFGTGRYQPHAAGDVLANQYGDCKDKHTLLASLLEAAHINAYAVLIHSELKLDPDVPSPLQFDHVITAIPQGKEYMWLDTTPEVAPFRLLSPNLRDKLALVIPPGGAAQLVRTPADSPVPNRFETTLEGRIDAQGRLTSTSRYQTRGDAELWFRMMFRRIPQAAWKDFGTSFARSARWSGDVSDVRVSDPSLTRDPFRWEMTITEPNAISWLGKTARMPLMMPPLELRDPPSGDKPMSKPLKIMPLEFSQRLKLELPADYKITIPVPVSVKRDYAEYHSSYKLEGTTLLAERTLRVLVRELPGARANDYRAFVRAVNADRSQVVSIESSSLQARTLSATADASELMDAAIAAFKNNDRQTWVELLQRVVKVEPAHKSAWNDLGYGFYLQREYEQAVKAYRKQIEVDPFNEHVHSNLGLALFELKDYAGAMTAFQAQLELNPLDGWAHYNLGRLYNEQGRFADGARELEGARAIEPTNAPVLVELGRSYLYLNRQREALDLFDASLEHASGPLTWNNIAYNLASANAELERAGRFAESAVVTTATALRNVSLEHLSETDLSRVDSIASYWDTLGLVAMQRGDLETARRYIYPAWQLSHHGEVGHHLAQLLERSGQQQEAIAAYARAAAGLEPYKDTRPKLVALVGEKKAAALIEKARGELVAQRTVAAGRLVPGEARGEVFLMFAPGPTVEAVRFIHGDDALRGQIEALRALKYPVSFPEGSATRLIRRATVTCPAKGDCSVELQLPETVTSVE